MVNLQICGSLAMHSVFSKYFIRFVLKLHLPIDSKSLPQRQTPTHAARL